MLHSSTSWSDPAERSNSDCKCKLSSYEVNGCGVTLFCSVYSRIMKPEVSFFSAWTENQDVEWLSFSPYRLNEVTELSLYWFLHWFLLSVPPHAWLGTGMLPRLPSKLICCTSAEESIFMLWTLLTNSLQYRTRTLVNISGKKRQKRKYSHVVIFIDEHKFFRSRIWCCLKGLQNLKFPNACSSTHKFVRKEGLGTNSQGSSPTSSISFSWSI